MKKKNLPKKKDAELTISKSPLTKPQLLYILQKTPPQHIYRRPAKGIAGEWEYVTGVYVKKVLNYVFGWLWDFEIVDKGREGDVVWVQGRLVIKNDKFEPIIIKEQFGRADIKYKKGKPHTPENMLDFGNDLKAAATDALKKCASELGIASDVYGKNEFKEIQAIDKGFVPVGGNSNGDLSPQIGKGKKLEELKSMLKGKTDEEKLADLRKRTGITLKTFRITERHAGILIAQLLNKEVK